MVGVPSVTSVQMAEIDRRMLEEFHVDLIMMMENAGRALAFQSRAMLGDLEKKKILVMAGKGNNGGGGLVSARFLHNWGANVMIALASPREEMKVVPRKQLEIAESLGLRISIGSSADLSRKRYHLVIDSLLGYNQKGDPRREVAGLVNAANASKGPILALDVPTGLDPDGGFPNQPCIRATQTLTLALPKRGLLRRKAKPYVGGLFLGDISVPLKVYHELGLWSSVFARDAIVRIS